MRTGGRPGRVVSIITALLFAFVLPTRAATSPVTIRGKDQILHLYGPADGVPVIVSSGDGGWVHLGPHVAEVLASRGFFVVGFDVRAYLSSFTSGNRTLGIDDEPEDYRQLAELASRRSSRKPILIGISEGAGLSVLAATSPRVKSVIAGVVGLGLPDRNELGWSWKDSLIYITHGTPNEPLFSAAAIVDRVAPLPLAAIQAAHDEFVGMGDVQKILSRAREPKRLWVVNASNHRFSDNVAEFDRRLEEAVRWVGQNSPR
jgi:fermentation-respiration switch protein FrsA (DUF1100 family)